MKVIDSIGFMILILGTLKAQQNISVLLLDDKNMAVKAEEVGEIKITLCGQDGTTILYTESFLTPQILNGRANLEIGAGTNHAPYIAAVNNHFKNLVPISESYIMVKIEASLKNGKMIKYNDEIKLNDPVPIIKVFNDQNVVVLPQGIKMAQGTRFAQYNAREVFLGDTSRELITSNFVDPTGMKLYEGDEQAAQFSRDGISISTQDNQYAQFLFNGGLKLQDNNFTSEFSLNGGSILNRLNEDVFDFSSNEISLGNSSGKVWFFNQSGGGFNPSANLSHLFNNNSFSIKDIASKRHTSFFYNGFTGYYDNQPKYNLGTLESGSPIFNFLSPANKLFYNMSPNTDGVIDITAFNPEGLFTYRSTTVSGTNGKNPFVYITQNGGAPGAGMYYNNQNVPVIFASVKNFRMDHPVLADQDIVYASLEGPEAAAYCRGKAKIQNGKTFISFPEHFQFVCSPDDLTVQLTPRSAQSKGLAVTRVGPDGFQVEELLDGKGNYEFYWEVKGTRKGFEDFQVIRPKSEIMPVPFMRPGTKE